MNNGELSDSVAFFPKAMLVPTSPPAARTSAARASPARRQRSGSRPRSIAQRRPSPTSAPPAASGRWVRWLPIRKAPSSTNPAARQGRRSQSPPATNRPSQSAWQPVSTSGMIWLANQGAAEATRAAARPSRAQAGGTGPASARSSASARSTTSRAWAKGSSRTVTGCAKGSSAKL